MGGGTIPMAERIFGEEWIQQSGTGFHLIGCRCAKCGTYWFPRRQVCPGCLADRLEEEVLSNQGEVYSYTKLHVVSQGFDKPLTIAYIDFPEGVRVCGQVEGEIEIGSRVEVAYGNIRTDPDGINVLSYKFKKVSKEV